MKHYYLPLICFVFFLQLPADVKALHLPEPPTPSNSKETGTPARIRWRHWVGLTGAQNNPVLGDDLVFVPSDGRVWNRLDESYSKEWSEGVFEDPEQGRGDGIFALDQETGKLKWFMGLQTELNGIAWSDGLLAFTGEKAYAGYNAQPIGQLGVIDTQSHRLLWNLPKDASEEAFYQPLIVNQQLVVGNAAGEVWAFALKTGKVLWQKTFEGSFRSAPVWDGKYLYLASTYGQVLCLTPNGTLIWKRSIEHAYPEWSQRTDRFPVEFYASPVLSSDLVILSFARNALYPEPALVALDKSTGKIRWWAKDTSSKPFAHANIRSKPVLWHQHVLVAESLSNHVLMLRADSGVLEKVMEIGQPTIPHWPSPVVAGDQLMLPRHDGYLYAWDLAQNSLSWKLYLGQRNLAGTYQGPTVKDPQRPAWMPDFGDAIYASPLLGPAGSIFVASDGYLYCMDVPPVSAH